MDLFQEIKNDYDLCVNFPEKYRDKVDSISKLLYLKDKNKLINTDCPVYIVGKYQISPIVMFGINPGYNARNNPKEDIEARKSWSNYLDLYENFYTFFGSKNFESPYYNSLRYLISGLTRLNISFDMKWKIFEQYLVNMELIPYHSRGIALPSKFNPQQLDYLKERLENSVNFLTKFNPKLFIFNGNPWYILLIKNRIIDSYEKISLTTKFNLYFFTINSIPSVVFDKFFQRHFWGITNWDRQNTIPNLLRDKYPNLSSINNQLS